MTPPAGRAVRAPRFFSLPHTPEIRTLTAPDTEPETKRGPFSIISHRAT